MPVRTEKRLRGVAVSTDQTLRMFPPCKSSGGAAGSDAPGSGAPGSGAPDSGKTWAYLIDCIRRGLEFFFCVTPSCV